MFLFPRALPAALASPVRRSVGLGSHRPPFARTASGWLTTPLAGPSPSPAAIIAASVFGLGSDLDPALVDEDPVHEKPEVTLRDGRVVRDEDVADRLLKAPDGLLGGELLRWGRQVGEARQRGHQLQPLRL